MSDPEPQAVGPGASRRRRRRRLLVITVVVAVVGTTGVVVFTRFAIEPKAAAQQVVRPPATAKVAKTDLIDRIKVDGDLGHGPASPVTGRKQGTVTWLPEPDRLIGRGETLYAVDAVGVPLLFGGVPLYREIREGVPVGPDVRTVQENLVELGYPEVGTPDGKFGPATTRALKKWQKAVGLAQSGALSPGDVLVLPGQVRVDTITARLGGPAEGDLMGVTGTERLVTVELEESSRQYAVVGAKVDVELPDRRTVPGTVRSVVAPTSKDKDSKFVVTVGLDDPAAAPATGLVRVVLSGTRHDGVLVVPVQALVALVEGGYAVEVVAGGERGLVAVEVGMFAAGQVEVSGPGLAEGAEVVTTS